ncbi:unnamed protein product, partial [Prunus brigantina]
VVPGLVWSEDANQADQGPLNPGRIAARVDLVSPRPARTCHQRRHASESHHRAVSASCTSLA